MGCLLSNLDKALSTETVCPHCQTKHKDVETEQIGVYPRCTKCGSPLPIEPCAGKEEEVFEFTVTVEALKHCKLGEDTFGTKGSKFFFKDRHGRSCKLFIMEDGLK